MKAQILIVTLFALSMAMTVLFFLYSPIKTQILRLTIMDNSFKAIAKSLSGLEISFYEANKTEDLSTLFNERISTSTPKQADSQFCGSNNCVVIEIRKSLPDNWIRSNLIYYNCDSRGCNPNGWKRFVIQSSGIENNITRTTFYTLKKY